MKKHNTISKGLYFWLGVLVSLTFSPVCFAIEPATVKVMAVHEAGKIQYTYRVSNNTSRRNIVSVSIGNRGLQPADSEYPQAQLFIYPADSYWGPEKESGDQRGESPRLGGIFTSPAGWVGKIQEYAETTDFSVDWNLDKSITSNFPVIYPGQTFDFGVTVPFNDDPRSPYSMSDPAYLTGHFTVGFDYSSETNEGPAFWDYTGIIVPIDTTPPMLTVTLNPATLWPPNNKAAQIIATISVSDDYDPEPEIKLESITSNETLIDGDIQDAQFFTDDRSFNLAAKRAGDNMAGRIYTITYSATDASGNKATATATVTVPHDQGK